MTLARIGSAISTNVDQLENCELRALVRTSALAVGIAAGILAYIYWNALPIYAIGLLAGGGGILFLSSCIDGCCAKRSTGEQKQVPRLDKQVEAWAGRKPGFSDVSDKQILDNIEAKTILGENLIHLIIKAGDFKKFVRVVQLVEQTGDLLKVKELLNEPGTNGHPLHYVCSNWVKEDVSVETRLQFIDVFLAKGININVQTGDDKDTPLDYVNQAAKTNKKLSEFYYELVQRGAKRGSEI